METHYTTMERKMGTEIFNDDNLYVKRTYQGIDKGTSFSVKIDRMFTQKEFSEFLSKCIDNLIVSGEGKR